jgi:hypothetical protein
MELQPVRRGLAESGAVQVQQIFVTNQAGAPSGSEGRETYVAKQTKQQHGGGYQGNLKGLSCTRRSQGGRFKINDRGNEHSHDRDQQQYDQQRLGPSIH